MYEKICLLLCLMVLGACASTPQSKQILSTSPENLPMVFEITETPFFPQTKYQCGPAALATVLSFHGVETSPELLAKQVYIPDRKGSLQIEMTAATRKHNMLPYTLEPKLLSLLAEIAAGNPVLVLQNLGFNWYPKWHYAVVTGYNLEKQELILRSGKTKHRVTPFKVFERTWQRSNFWALVIVPVGQIPKTAQPLPYLKTVYDFEELSNFDAATTAYRSASKAWPQSPDTWMVLGNMAFQNQDWSEAIEAFTTATQLTPDATASWNNLAYALHANGCGVQAMLSLQCALSISPDDENLQNSLNDLRVKPTTKHIDECPQIECKNIKKIH